jgi:hypothetical protein
VLERRHGPEGPLCLILGFGVLTLGQLVLRDWHALTLVVGFVLTALGIWRQFYPRPVAWCPRCRRYR